MVTEPLNGSVQGFNVREICEPIKKKEKEKWKERDEAPAELRVARQRQRDGTAGCSACWSGSRRGNTVERGSVTPSLCFSTAREVSAGDGSSGRRSLEAGGGRRSRWWRHDVRRGHARLESRIKGCRHGSKKPEERDGIFTNWPLNVLIFAKMT